MSLKRIQVLPSDVSGVVLELRSVIGEPWFAVLLSTYRDVLACWCGIYDVCLSTTDGNVLLDMKGEGGCGWC